MTLTVELPPVTLAVAIPSVTSNSGEYAEFMMSIPAPLDHDLHVNYTVKGSGTNGVDYLLLKGVKKIKAGKTSKPIKIFPLSDLDGASKKTVALTLAPGDGYTVGTTGKVKVKILAAQ